MHSDVSPDGPLSQSASSLDTNRSLPWEIEEDIGAQVKFQEHSHRIFPTAYSISQMHSSLLPLLKLLPSFRVENDVGVSQELVSLVPYVHLTNPARF